MGIIPNKNTSWCTPNIITYRHCYRISISLHLILLYRKCCCSMICMMSFYMSCYIMFMYTNIITIITRKHYVYFHSLLSFSFLKLDWIGLDWIGIGWIGL